MATKHIITQGLGADSESGKFIITRGLSPSPVAASTPTLYKFLLLTDDGSITTVDGTNPTSIYGYRLIWDEDEDHYLVAPPIPVLPFVSVLDSVNDSLEELFQHRGKVSVGGNSLRLGVELTKGEMVPILAYEPDAATFRGPYYYNSVENVLYKKAVVDRKPHLGISIAHWKRISA